MAREGKKRKKKGVGKKKHIRKAKRLAVERRKMERLVSNLCDKVDSCSDQKRDPRVKKKGKK